MSRNLAFNRNDEAAELTSQGFLTLGLLAVGFAPMSRNADTAAGAHEPFSGETSPRRYFAVVADELVATHTQTTSLPIL